MQYFSTNRKSPAVSFRDAVINGQPADLGLYFPSEIPRVPDDLVRGLSHMENSELAFRVIRPFVAGDIPDEELFSICAETVDIDFPLVRLTEEISALELLHGPTFAFKDVGAGFISRCLGYFSGDSDRKTIVIVATSGDTGSAVAAGFHGVENVEVIILYPLGKVSRVQEQQLTAFGDNVTTLALRGTFDDCQALAKRALADPELQARARLTSANSINIARWLPQQFYYFFALKQWGQGMPPVFSVPSGNFGNLAAGLLAHISGMPAAGFIAACNANDVVPRFLESGVYEPRPPRQTLSNAMDVGEPSNFVRILELFDSVNELKRSMRAVSVSDEETAQTMREVYNEHGYMLDPHGAVAFRALYDNLSAGQRGIFLETAHPVKFDSVGEIIGVPPPVPDAILELSAMPHQSVEIPNDYAALRDIIIDKM